MHIGRQLRETNLEQVELITKEYGIIYEAWGGENRPAMEPTELRDSQILREVMGNMDEGTRRLVPKRTKEVGHVALGKGKGAE